MTYTPFREGASPRLHAAANAPLRLESDEKFRAQLARLEHQVTNQLAQERPSMAQREASGVGHSWLKDTN